MGIISGILCSTLLLVFICHTYIYKDNVSFVEQSGLTARFNDTFGQENACIKTKTVPSFFICPYSEMEDIYISRALRSSGTWDPVMTKLLTQIFKEHANLTLIDVGANIGYFSLLAAKLGVAVVAAEPVKENSDRLLKARALNKLGQGIKVKQYAVSNKRSRLLISVPKDNQGGGKVVLQGEWKPGGRIRTVDAVLLEDVADCIETTDVVLKLDIGWYFGTCSQSPDFVNLFIDF